MSKTQGSGIGVGVPRSPGFGLESDSEFRETPTPGTGIRWLYFEHSTTRFRPVYSGLLAGRATSSVSCHP